MNERAIRSLPKVQQTTAFFLLLNYCRELEARIAALEPKAGFCTDTVHVWLGFDEMCQCRSRRRSGDATP